MSRRGETLRQKVDGLIQKYSSDPDFATLIEVLQILRDLNDGMEVLEKEIGLSDAFVDIHNANTRISSI